MLSSSGSGYILGQLSSSGPGPGWVKVRVRSKSFELKYLVGSAEVKEEYMKLQVKVDSRTILYLTAQKLKVI